MANSNIALLTLLVFCVAGSIVASGVELEVTGAPSATISPHQYRWMNCLDIKVTTYNAYLSMSMLGVTNGAIFVGGSGGLHAYLRALDVATGNVIGALNYSVPVPNGVTSTGIFVTGAVDPQTDVFMTYVLTQYTVSAFSGPSFYAEWTTQIYSGSTYQTPVITGRFLCLTMQSNTAACYRTGDGTLEWTGGIGYTSTLLASDEILLLSSTSVSGFNLSSATSLWSEPCNQSYPNGYPACNGATAVSDGMIFYRRAVLSLRTGKLAWKLDAYTSFGGYMGFSTTENIVVLLNLTRYDGWYANELVAYNTNTGRHLWSTPLSSSGTNYVSINFLKTDNFRSFVAGTTSSTGFQYLTGNLLTGEISEWKNVATPVTLQSLFSAGKAGAVGFASSPLQEYCIIGL